MMRVHFTTEDGELLETAELEVNPNAGFSQVELILTAIEAATTIAARERRAEQQEV